MYALGALSQHEARAFEIHLRQGCEVCLRELNEFTGVVDALSTGTTEITPPGYLRDLLNARIEKEAILPVTASPLTAQVVQFPERAQPSLPVVAPRSAFTGWLPWAAAALDFGRGMKAAGGRVGSPGTPASAGPATDRPSSRRAITD